MKKKESSICLLQCVCLTKLFTRKLSKLNGNMLKDFKTVLDTWSIPYNHMYLGITGKQYKDAGLKYILVHSRKITEGSVQKAPSRKI